MHILFKSQDSFEGGKFSTSKDDTLMKVNKTTKITQKKVSFLSLICHFESDMKSSEEGDDGDVEITYTTSCFHERKKKKRFWQVMMIVLEKELHSIN